MRFLDRKDAGEQLGQILSELSFIKPIVFGLARGGVPVAYEIAKKIKAPLDVLVVRKLGAPLNPEFAIGAIAPEGFVELNYESIGALNISDYEMEEITDKEQKELLRRIKKYRGIKEFPKLLGRDVILVDDGVATGTSAKVAINYLKSKNPKRIILASPVCAKDSERMLKKETDKAICVISPEDFSAVGEWYESFSQTSDEEIISLLR